MPTLGLKSKSVLGPPPEKERSKLRMYVWPTTVGIAAAAVIVSSSVPGAKNDAALALTAVCGPMGGNVPPKLAGL